MSGPVTTNDAPDVPTEEDASPQPIIEISRSREATVGTGTVRRALPQRHRRTVGAWCFADHFGPTGPGGALSIGPHPHMGLQTVTWQVVGELVHYDSLGSEQLIRPGELNVMTAGAGVAHAEEVPTTYSGGAHGIQLWVAQPESTRHGQAAFAHHASLPRVDMRGGVATVLVGAFESAVSPARADTPLVGVELALSAGTHELPLRPDFEHALVVLEGELQIDDGLVRPGVLAYLGGQRDKIALTTSEMTRAMLLGGEPFPGPILMWWNFVARTRDEVDLATKDWNAESERFGQVASTLQRIPAPATPWAHS